LGASATNAEAVDAKYRTENIEFAPGAFRQRVET
jgi:hypothetical protein